MRTFALVDTQRLTKDLIPDPRLWRLCLRLDAECLQAMLCSSADRSQVICRRLPVDTQMPSPLRALEEVVYDNPLLLSDFRRVSIAVDEPRHLLVPPEVPPLPALFSLPDPDAVDLIKSECGATNAVSIMALDAEMAAFLRRTFVNPVICHRLSPLCRYFTALGAKGNTVKTYVHLQNAALDVIVTDRAGLVMANTFRFRVLSDAVYYILACRQTLGLGHADGETLVCGDPSLRDQAMTALREYLVSVMPVIFPSDMLQAAGDAALGIPYDLLVLPLCE